MELIYRIFKLDKNSREGIISATSILNIIVNVLIALSKIVVGLLSSSIAIVSEGVNNAADVLSSLLTLIGTKLAQKKPNADHPFGYGRIEYLTGLVISILIIYGGIQMISESIRLMFNPEEVKISYVSLAVVAVTAIIKFMLGNYTVSMGRKAESDTLEAVGVECRNDSYGSVLTIASALIYLLASVSIDAYVGLFTSCMIVKAGVDILRSTISKLLGQPAEKQLVNELYSEIRNTKGIINAVDMVLHDYGPDAYTGSVNVELDHSKSIGEMYPILRQLQIRIHEKYNVVMVFGFYAVDPNGEKADELIRTITAYVRNEEHVKSYHAVYHDPDTNRIYCDLVLDYDAEPAEVIGGFREYMKKYYPDKEIQVNIDTEFV